MRAGALLHLVALAALPAIATMACYRPRPATGAPCGTGGVCPMGLVCSAATQTCELHDVDAAVAVVPDGPPPDSPTPFCYGTGIVRVCFAQLPTGNTSLATATTINTDSDPGCAPLVPPGETDVCAFAASTIDVAGAIVVKATGSRALVLVGVNSIAIDGTLDASSVDGSPGPNSDPASCVAGTAATASGGGYGGSFGGVGGSGGSTEGGVAPPAIANPTTLRGGCPSGDSGGGVHGVPGGGAVFLIANGAIIVNGTINASGDAGEGGSGTAQGGSGGGSGGMIGLDAPMVSVASTGQVFANGGGGGEGGGMLASNDGAVPTAATAAAGGGSGGDGGDGGDGAAGSTLTGAAGLDGGANGDGGGGGGAGVVKIYATTKTLIGPVSPPAS